MHKPFGNDPGIFLPYWIYAISNSNPRLNIVMYTTRNAKDVLHLYSLKHGKLKPFFHKTPFAVLDYATSVDEVVLKAESLGKVPIRVQTRRLDPEFEKAVFETGLASK